MNELIVVLGPPGMEREAVQKSVESTGEFKAMAAGELKELTRRNVNLSGVTCVLQMSGADFKSNSSGSTAQETFLRVLVETGDTPDSWLIDGLRNGAVAVIVWPCLANELRAAIKATRRGEAYLTPKAGGLLVDGMRSDRPRRLWELVLTARGRQVARCLCAGHTNKEIGEALRITESTVECHLTNIYRKLGVQSRAEAAVRINQNPKAKLPGGMLTSVERQVVEAILKGCGNDEVAERLHISRHTIETHLTHAYQKLGVRNRVELIAKQAAPSAKQATDFPARKPQAGQSMQSGMEW